MNVRKFEKYGNCLQDYAVTLQVCEDNKFWEKDFKTKKREENGNLNFKFKTKLLKSDLAKENQENDPRCIFLQQRIKF